MTVLDHFRCRHCHTDPFRDEENVERKQREGTALQFLYWRSNVNELQRNL